MRITFLCRRNAHVILMGAMSGLSMSLLTLHAIPASLVQKERGIETMNIAAANEIQAAPLTDEEWKTFKDERESLLTRSLTLRLPDKLIQERGVTQTSWTIPLFDHPELVILHRNENDVGATIDPARLRTFIEQEILPVIPRAEHIVITTLPEEGKTRATLEGSRRDGWMLGSEDAAIQISRQIAKTGELTAILPVMRESGTIQNETDVNLGEFELLSRGRSNFAGSDGGRKFNVRKALREHVYGTLVEPGGVFSFNATLDGSVETWTGWVEALGIFNGIDLKPTAGGGICQASTTVYRAAVLAGLPILEQRNHSLYVKYYGSYGEGLDATVYPGQQDLTFLNDTPGALLFLAWTEGDEATVEIYGTPDGRTVTLEGPYRSWNATKEIRNHESLASPLFGNTIGWLQRITHADGTVEEKMLTSIYTSEIPVTAPRNASVITGNAL